MTDPRAPRSPAAVTAGYGDAVPPDVAADRRRTRRDGRTDPPTVEQAARRLAADFRMAGLATPALDTRVLVCAACDLAHEEFAGHPERPLTTGQSARLAGFRKRRLAREPVSRILGEREFRGLAFTLVPATLDPRPDTETVVEAALALTGGTGRDGVPLSILDLGTGSGCILLSLLHALPHAAGVGTDTNPAALVAARANAARLGLSGRARFACGSWLDAVAGPFGLVVCNPPYVPSGDIAGLADEVAAFEPRGALDGGEDGLAAYRRFVPALSRVLAPGGWAVLEVGAGQAEPVSALMAAHGLTCSADGRGAWRDLSGTIRAVAAKRG